ncbi:MAG: hypothetical protein Q8O92_14010 [Candidatus Latescibacter sp.]|nr:hypothetical protein [Candidatus Latescibacter sp.]
MSEENSLATRKCPFCAEEILSDAVKCKHCGEWLDKQPIGPQKTLGRIERHSNAQAPWRLVLLSIISFTIYEIYWFYRNWKHLKIQKRLEISPGWRTVGLCIPIYHIFIIYEQFRDIRDSAKQAGCETFSSPGWITFGFIFLSGISLRLSLYQWKLTDPGEVLAITVLSLFIDLLAVWILVVVQKTLNRFWAKEQPDHEMRSKFSGKEIALIVVGVIVWILGIIGTFVPE